MKFADLKPTDQSDSIYKAYSIYNIMFPQMSTGIAIGLASSYLSLLSDKNYSSFREIALFRLNKNKLLDNLDLANKMHKSFNVQVDLTYEGVAEQYIRQLSLALGLIQDLLNLQYGNPDYDKIREERKRKIGEKSQEPSEIADSIDSVMRGHPEALEWLVEILSSLNRSLVGGKTKKNVETEAIDSLFLDMNLVHEDRLDEITRMIQKCTSPYELIFLMKIVSKNVNAYMAEQVRLGKAGLGLKLFESDYKNRIYKSIRLKILDMISTETQRKMGLKFDIRKVF